MKKLKLTDIEKLTKKNHKKLTSMKKKFVEKMRERRWLNGQAEELMRKTKDPEVRAKFEERLRRDREPFTAKGGARIWVSCYVDQNDPKTLCICRTDTETYK